MGEEGQAQKAKAGVQLAAAGRKAEGCRAPLGAGGWGGRGAGTLGGPGGKGGDGRGARNRRERRLLTRGVSKGLIPRVFFELITSY